VNKVSNWREEVQVLECGCKIGRTGKGGQWFYDYLCDKHVKDVQDAEGHYSYDKALAMTEKLNKEMKENARKEKEQQERLHD
jgi:hypothetical protein